MAPPNVRVVELAKSMSESAERASALLRLIVAVVANVPPWRVKAPALKLFVSEIFKVPAETVRALVDSLLLALSVKLPAPVFSNVYVPERALLRLTLTPSATSIAEWAESVIVLLRSAMLAVMANVPPSRVNVPPIKLLATAMLTVPAETFMADDDKWLSVSRVSVPFPALVNAKLPLIIPLMVSAVLDASDMLESAAISTVPLIVAEPPDVTVSAPALDNPVPAIFKLPASVMPLLSCRVAPLLIVVALVLRALLLPAISIPAERVVAPV